MSLQVRRVQNPKSYFLYDSNRAFVAQKLSRREDQVETTPLWHATAEENIQKITHGKFDRRLSGKVGEDFFLELSALSLVSNPNVMKVFIYLNGRFCYFIEPSHTTTLSMQIAF